MRQMQMLAFRHARLKISPILGKECELVGEGRVSLKDLIDAPKGDLRFHDHGRLRDDDLCSHGVCAT